jgi:hypothetical protein
LGVNKEFSARDAGVYEVRQFYLYLSPGSPFRMASSADWGFQERDAVDSGQSIGRAVQKQYKWEHSLNKESRAVHAMLYLLVTSAHGVAEDLYC